MDPEERALIRQAQRGNVEAFEFLIKKYDRQVLKLARSFVNNVEDALDIYQEVFLRVYRNLHRFEFKSEFSTWLYRVVANHCINFRKKKSRTTKKEVMNFDEAFTIKDDGKDPERSYLNKELAAQIDEALEKLPGRQKMVFVLRHYHGHKLREIAQIMDCSEGTIKNYLFRATEKMQKFLKPYAQIER